jgi:hypothetical protein
LHERACPCSSSPQRTTIYSSGHLRRKSLVHHKLVLWLFIPSVISRTYLRLSFIFQNAGFKFHTLLPLVLQ